MHCVELVQIAATLTRHYGSAITSPAYDRMSPAVRVHRIAQYWVASRSRFDLWNRTLARHREAEARGRREALEIWWLRHTGVLEEILVSDLLTRVVASLCHQLDRGGLAKDWSPVTHTIYLHHLDVLNRLEPVLLNRRGQAIQCTLGFGRLRQIVANWTDRLIGTLGETTGDFVYAADPQRASDFADEQRDSLRGDDDVQSQRALTLQILEAAMVDSLRRGTRVGPSLPSSTRQIGESVLGLFAADGFDAWGVPHGHVVARIRDDVSPESDRSPGSNAATAESEPFDLETVNFLDSAETELDTGGDRWFLA